MKNNNRNKLIMLSVVLLALSLVWLGASPVQATMVNDPQGDYLPWAVPGGFMDIQSVETQFVGMDLLISAMYYNSIGYSAPTPSGISSFSRGMLQMDVDQDPTTGAPFLYNGPSPVALNPNVSRDLSGLGLAPIGVEFVAVFQWDQVFPPSGAGLSPWVELYATNGSTDETQWTDLTSLGISDGDYGFSITFPGTALLPDWAPMTDIDFTLFVSGGGYPDINPQDVAQHASMAAVPEPGSLFLLGTGMLGLVRLIRKRERK